MSASKSDAPYLLADTDALDMSKRSDWSIHVRKTTGTKENCPIVKDGEERTKSLNVRERPQGGEDRPKFEEVNFNHIDSVKASPQRLSKNTPGKASDEILNEAKVRRTKIHRISRRKEIITGTEQWIDGPNALPLPVATLPCVEPEHWVDGPTEFSSVQIGIGVDRVFGSNVGDARVDDRLIAEAHPTTSPNKNIISDSAPNRHDDRTNKREKTSMFAMLSPSCLQSNDKPTSASKLQSSHRLKKYHTLGGTTHECSLPVPIPAEVTDSPVRQTVSARSSPRRCKDHARMQPGPSGCRVSGDRTADWVKHVQESSKVSRLLHLRPDLIPSQGESLKTSSRDIAGRRRGGVRTSAVFDSLDAELECMNYSPPPDYASCMAELNNRGDILDINENMHFHSPGLSTGCTNIQATELKVSLQDSRSKSCTTRKSSGDKSMTTRKASDHIDTIGDACTMTSDCVVNNMTAPCDTTLYSSKSINIVARLCNPDGASNPNLAPGTAAVLENYPVGSVDIGQKFSTPNDCQPERSQRPFLVNTDADSPITKTSSGNERRSSNASVTQSGNAKAVAKVVSTEEFETEAVNEPVASEGHAHCAESQTSCRTTASKSSVPSSAHTTPKRENKLASLFSCISPKLKLRSMLSRSPNLGRKNASKSTTASRSRAAGVVMHDVMNGDDDDGISLSSFQFDNIDVSSRSYFRFDNFEPTTTKELNGLCSENICDQCCATCCCHSNLPSHMSSCETANLSAEVSSNDASYAGRVPKLSESDRGIEGRVTDCRTFDDQSHVDLSSGYYSAHTGRKCTVNSSSNRDSTSDASCSEQTHVCSKCEVSSNDRDVEASCDSSESCDVQDHDNECNLDSGETSRNIKHKAGLTVSLHVDYCRSVA